MPTNSNRRTSRSRKQQRQQSNETTSKSTSSLLSCHKVCIFSLVILMVLVHRKNEVSLERLTSVIANNSISGSNSNNDNNNKATTNNKFLRFGEIPVPKPKCTNPKGDNNTRFLQKPPFSTFSSDIYTCNNQCSNHSTCYFGTCLCHPGYEGIDCNQKMEIANPWYTIDCPNLHDQNTLDVNRTIFGSKDCPNSEGADLGTGLSYCAYLCYSNEIYGSVIVPYALWSKAQDAENTLWQKVRGTNDRYNDHFEGFANYINLPNNLGHVIEIGAGPWTQFRGLLHLRPDIKINSYTILEPGANYYMNNVATCAYKTGKLTKHPETNQFHDFPIHIKSKLGGTYT